MIIHLGQKVLSLIDKRIATLLVLCLTPLLSGCISSTQTAVAAGVYDVTKYRAGNPIFGYINTGYQQKKVAKDHYEIKASGSPVTPPQHVAKIAFVRAADIGEENGFSYFQVVKKTSKMHCEGPTSISDRFSLQAKPIAIRAAYAYVTLEVKYSNTQPRAKNYNINSLLAKHKSEVLKPKFSEEQEKKIYNNNKQICYEQMWKKSQKKT